MPVSARALLFFLSFTLFCFALAAHAATPVGTPLAISHRACMHECAENTLSAIAWAAESGVDFVEIDLRATRDDELVVIHDRTVNRTTNGRGQVKNLTLSEIRLLDVDGGERIPTVDEAFAFIRQTQLGVLIDLKDVQGIDPAVVYAALVRRNLRQRVVIGVRSVGQLKAFKALDPALATLSLSLTVGSIQRYMDHGVDIVRLWPRWIRANSALLDKIRDSGREVWVTSGSLRGDELADLLASDIQGLITDHPGEVVQHRVGFNSR